MAIKSVCESCGRTLSGEAVFCPDCGNRLTKVDDSVNAYAGSVSGVNNGAYNNTYHAPQNMSYNNVNYNNNDMNNTAYRNAYGYPSAAGIANEKSNVPGIIGMTLGIISLITFMFNLLDLPVALTSLILSIVGLTGKRKKGTAVAGLICSILAILLIVLLFIRMYDITYGFAFNPNELFPDDADDIIEAILDF